VALIRFLRRGNTFIKLNLLWAFAYNVVIMPVVAGAFYSLNVYVTPVMSAIAMSCSSLLVVGLSYMLNFLHYDDSLNEKAMEDRHTDRKEEDESNRNYNALDEDIN
jgi:hypothetical protein